nr:helix-turn-helix transcriptional regulator [Maliibacterium massiliense]
MEKERFDVGEKLRVLMQQRGLSGNALAYRSGVSQSAISAILRNKRSPTIETLSLMLAPMGVTLGEFFGHIAQEAVQCASPIAQRIHQLRVQRALSVHQLSELSGLSASRIADYEQGAYTPGADVLMQLCAGLGVTLSAFFNAAPFA